MQRALLSAPLAILLLVGLTQCHRSTGDAAGDAGAPEKQGDGSRKPVIDLDLSGDVTGHVSISGGSQIGKLEPGFIGFTLSQTNDAPEDASTRLTFSMQSKDLPTVGQTLRGQGHLVYNGETFHTTLCEAVVSSETPPTGPSHARWLEGTFVCHDMRGPGHKKAEVTGGHFLGKFTDLTTP